jgi:hypothetical protein
MKDKLIARPLHAFVRGAPTGALFYHNNLDNFEAANFHTCEN